MRVVFVHGACVRDGAWWWRHVDDVLRRRDVLSSAPLLPSCGETGEAPGASGPGLSDDAASVRRELESSDEPTVVVAHSYAGIVVAEAAAGLPQVRHLLGIASFLPAVGESLASFGDGTPAPYLDVDAAGTFGVRPQTLHDTFLHDCPLDELEGARVRLARQSIQVTTQPVQASAWSLIPSSYLVCANDRGTPPGVQREQARRATRAVEIKAGHHPFLARPSAVAELILEVAEA